MKKGLLLLVILANLGVVVCGIGFLVSQNHMRVRMDAVSQGLLACCDAATSEKEGVISPDRVRRVIQAELSGPAEKVHLLPSFVTANDVFFANRAVAKGSDETVCAVRVGNGKYCAVKGNRASVLLDQSGMDAWAHSR
jgi:hypothetical protein